MFKNQGITNMWANFNTFNGEEDNIVARKSHGA